MRGGVTGVAGAAAAVAGAARPPGTAAGVDIGVTEAAGFGAVGAPADTLAPRSLNPVADAPTATVPVDPTGWDAEAPAPCLEGDSGAPDWWLRGLAVAGVVVLTGPEAASDFLGASMIFSLLDVFELVSAPPVLTTTRLPAADPEAEGIEVVPDDDPDAEVAGPVDEPGDETEDAGPDFDGDGEPDEDDEELEDKPVSAHVTPHPVATAAPTPNASTNPPTRPTHFTLSIATPRVGPTGIGTLVQCTFARIDGSSIYTPELASTPSYRRLKRKHTGWPGDT